MDYKMNKRGQIAIFVVIGIILVAGILLLAFLRNSNRIGTTSVDSSNAEQYIGKCVRDSAQKALDKMIPQGGFVSPGDYKTYNNIKATYICKNVNSYEPCINQYPQYMHSVEQELVQQVRKDIGGCFSALTDELKRKNYDVTYTSPELNVSIKPEVVHTQILTKMTITKSAQTQNYDEFNVDLRSPIYNLIYTAQIIASQEAQYCYFEYVGYSLLHPEVSVKKFTMSDASRVYTIRDSKTKIEMNIAVRGCAIPAGF